MNPTLNGHIHVLAISSDDPVGTCWNRHRQPTPEIGGRDRRVPLHPLDAFQEAATWGGDLRFLQLEKKKKTSSTAFWLRYVEILWC